MHGFSTFGLHNFHVIATSDDYDAYALLSFGTLNGWTLGQVLDFKTTFGFIEQEVY